MRVKWSETVSKLPLPHSAAHHPLPFHAVEVEHHHHPDQVLAGPDRRLVEQIHVQLLGTQALQGGPQFGHNKAPKVRPSARTIGQRDVDHTTQHRHSTATAHSHSTDTPQSQSPPVNTRHRAA